MSKSSWKRKIKDATEAAGTYRSYFDSIIDILADIMDKRDQAQQKYVESGENPTITYENAGGAVNTVKNPALVLIMDLNTQALAYWRDLGLTPSGLKKINAEQLENKPKSGFVELLGKFSA